MMLFYMLKLLFFYVTFVFFVASRRFPVLLSKPNGVLVSPC
jgi:hypothetical protein